jgi:hypothetical protein
MPKSSVPKAGAPRRLARAAYLLYGPQHVEHIAHLLGVDRKTVYRWRAGITPVPDYAWEPLKVALVKRVKDINEWVKS